jgi:carboxyl-terminal processing protease
MLDDGELGFFQNREGRREAWRQDPALRPEAEVDLRNMPVAVLIGPGTASSGEAVALSFRGRARTRFFGEPSAGLSTGNQVYPLPDGAQIVLTGVIMLDRNGRGDGERLMPDEILPAKADGADAVDPAIDAVIRWLSSNG